MSIKNIKDLVIKQKQEFLGSHIDKNELFIKEVKRISIYCSLYEAIFIIIPFSIILVILSSLPILFINSLVIAAFSFLLVIFGGIFSFLHFYPKIKQKRVTKKIMNNEKVKNEFLNNVLLPHFETTIINDEILQYLKLHLTLDQFKALKVMSKNCITYQSLMNFIDNIEDINSSIKDAEHEKYTLEYNDVQQYIKTI